MRSGTVGVTLKSLNQTTEETGRFFRLGEGDAFGDLRDGEGEWRLLNADTRLKDLSEVGVTGDGVDHGTIAVLLTDGERRGEGVALQIGGG